MSIEPKSDTWCIHFTGVQKNICEAGMTYRDMWDNNRKLPCILASGSTTICPHLQAPTPEQVAEFERQTEELMQQLLTDINTGACPHCHKPLQSERQVGRCVYGSCGCRLWQGKARTPEELRRLQEAQP